MPNNNTPRIIPPNVDRTDIHPENNCLLTEEEIRFAANYFNTHKNAIKLDRKIGDGQRKLPFTVVKVEGKLIALYRGKEHKGTKRGLGKGAFGSAKLAQVLSDKSWVVDKTVERFEDKANEGLNLINEQQFQAEINILRKREKLKGYTKRVTFENAEYAKEKHYLFIDYEPGQTLEDILLEKLPKEAGKEQKFRSKKIPFEERVGLAQNVVEALMEVHRLGVIHRDIKLDNIMVDRENADAELIDYGLSQEIPEGSFIEDAIMVGTPGYIAPEISRGSEKNGIKSRYSKQSDIYALGKVIENIFQEPNGEKGSQNIAELVKGLIRTDPEQRLNLNAAYYTLAQLNIEVQLKKALFQQSINPVLTDALKNLHALPAEASPIVKMTKLREILLELKRPEHLKNFPRALQAFIQKQSAKIQYWLDINPTSRWGFLRQKISAPTRPKGKIGVETMAKPLRFSTSNRVKRYRPTVIKAEINKEQFEKIYNTVLELTKHQKDCTVIRNAATSTSFILKRQKMNAMSQKIAEFIFKENKQFPEKSSVQAKFDQPTPDHHDIGLVLNFLTKIEGDFVISGCGGNPPNVRAAADLIVASIERGQIPSFSPKTIAGFSPPEWKQKLYDACLENAKKWDAPFGQEPAKLTQFKQDLAKVLDRFRSGIRTSPNFQI